MNHEAHPDSSQAHHNPIGDAANRLFHEAASAWSATKGGTRVAEQAAVGIGKQVIEHPLTTAAEVGASVLIAGAAVETGIGVAGIAAVAAIPLAGYGLYKGAQIASREGVGAIPKHIAAAYHHAKESVESTAASVATVYHGGDPAKLVDAERQVQNVGRASVPFIAGALGGGASELGSAVIGTVERGGITAAKDIMSSFPSMTLQPALADGGVYSTAGAIAQATSRASIAIGEGAAATSLTGTGPTIMNQMSRETEGAGGSGGESGGNSLSQERNRARFIDGRVAPIRAPEGPSLMKTWQSIFKDPEAILKGKPKVEFGNMEVENLGDGTYMAKVIDGPKADTAAIYKKGDPTFSADSAPGQPLHNVEISH